ncbi:response regulator [Paenibacillus hemerocallicola]|nr:response regulator [Paenibacillus hemerocallicola]
MNVLIVDDQRLSRAGLVKMIEWEKLGLTPAGECANGRDALERIGDAEADIVITDVRMPIMNGLELIEKAKEQYPDIAYVVVSGYDDFQYVRKSIQLTVADYLLKPVDPGELNELLAGLVRRGEERHRKAEADLLRWREQFFHFLLEGAYGETGSKLISEFAEIRFADPEDRFVAAVFESRLDKPAVYETLRPLADRLAVCVLRIRGVYLLIAAAPSLVAGDIASELKRLADSSREIARISIGNAAEGIIKVKETVGQAFDAYTIRTSRKADRADEPATFESLEAETADFVPLSAAWEQEWAFHLRQGNRRAALDKLDELLDIGHSAHPDIVDGSYHYVLLRGARELYEAGLIREPDFLEACRIARSLPSIVSLDDKQRTVTDFFRNRLKETDSENAMETRLAVEKAKAYIDTHYCQTINLSELAQNSYMSPGYFSSLFRQHTGRNFLDYVAHLRIEHAKSLLAADPSRKIADVALQCGYQDLKYFRKLFKRHTGITPVSYKEDAAR